jgi:hypothetical protein
MNEIFAANATIELYSPLLIGTAMALFIVLIGRLVAARKIRRALAADDPIDPIATPNLVPLAEREASMLAVPGWIETMPTRKFVRDRA